MPVRFRLRAFNKLRQILRFLPPRCDATVTQRELLPAIECEFSPCRRYRYTWTTTWNRELPPCAFIGLNPSTADENAPDPTVRRCIAYARGWGYGRLIMLNLFAYRATEPMDMKMEHEPVGPDNNRWLRDQVGFVTLMGGVVIAAWGTHGTHLNRQNQVRNLLSSLPLHYLKLTKDGHPGHPLYLKGDLTPRRWT